MIGLSYTENGKRVIDPNWRIIPGYDGMYEISSMGEVRSWKNSRYPGRAKKPKLLKTITKKSSKAHGSCNRTPYVRLYKEKGKKDVLAVHLLMRDVWMKGKRPNMVVYHRNGDVTDPCLHNLAYIRKSELGKKSGGKANRIPVVKIDRNGEIVECYRSAREAGRKNFMSYDAVLNRCHHKTKNPFALNGYSFRFERD